MQTGIIVDLETTGLNPQEDQIVEVGLVTFQWDGATAPTIVSMYSGLQDPGRPLSDVVKKLTGLSDGFLAGRHIQWDVVAKQLQAAHVVVAHNMDFDRAFLQGVPALKEFNRSLPWACSLRHIDWAKHGFQARSLTYLAADHGFINPFPHRALFDCATTFKLAAPHLDEMIARSKEAEFWLYAVNSPFDSKDKLRTAGFRWDPDRRVWKKLVSESQQTSELAFLKAEIYPPQFKELPAVLEKIVNGV